MTLAFRKPTKAWPQPVKIGPTGQVMLKILEYYPHKKDIIVNSGMDSDHGTVSHHYGLTFQGSPTCAIDFVSTRGAAGMRDLASWIYQWWRNTVELIHTTPFNTDNGFYVKNCVRYPGGGPYRGATALAHKNHVHWAASRKQLDTILAYLVKKYPASPAPLPTPPKPPAPNPLNTVVKNQTPVWVADVSNHDNKRKGYDLDAMFGAGIDAIIAKSSEGTTFLDPYFKTNMNKAKMIGFPVLGAYHVLWPGSVTTAKAEAKKFFDNVAAACPWWTTVPFVWMGDFEKLGAMPRCPNQVEIVAFMDEVKRLAGGRGAFWAYAPKWQYGESLTALAYDIVSSNYSGSGASRPFEQQWQSVLAAGAPGWATYSGHKPVMYQFASDALRGGTNPPGDINIYRGDLHTLVKATGRIPVQPSA